MIFDGSNLKRMILEPFREKKKKRDGGESLFDATSEKEKPTPKTHHELKERAQKRERERATRE
jgi:hypothetical protein